MNLLLRNYPKSDLGRLIVDVSKPRTIRHIYPIGLPWNSDQPVAEAATYTTHNKHKSQISMPSAACEPAIPKLKRPTP
jgi:hypothetical protein